MEQSPLERAMQALEIADSSDFYEKQTKDYKGMVCAVLEAIREPSEAMVEAAERVPWIDDDGAEPTPVWQAMLDTALKDE